MPNTYLISLSEFDDDIFISNFLLYQWCDSHTQELIIELSSFHEILFSKEEFRMPIKYQ